MDNNQQSNVVNSNSRKSNNNEKNGAKLLLIIAIIGGAILLLLLLALLFWLLGNDKKNVNETTEQPIKKETVVLENDEPVIDTSITLAFCGDSMVHIPQAMDAYNENDGSYNFNSTFEFIKDDIEFADFAVTNLETVFAGLEPSGYPRFSSPDEWADALKYAGFDMVTTANNHSLDQKVEGLYRTLDVLDNVGLSHIGTYKTKEEYEKTKGTVIKDINGYRIGFMSLAKGSNGFSIPNDNPYALNVYTTDYHGSEYQKNVDYDKIKEEIDYLKNENVDIIIALMHWGLEDYKTPAPQQEKIAKYLTDNGVKIVMGTHPNVLQKYDYNSENNTIVVYSLGNFISSMTKDYTETSGIMYVKLDRNDNNVVEMKEIYYKPTMTLIRDRGITPRFFVVNTHKTLENIVRKDDDKLLSYMTKDVVAKLRKSLNRCHEIWGNMIDYYVKYNEVDYTDDDLESIQTQIVLEKNLKAQKLLPKKKNWIN